MSPSLSFRLLSAQSDARLVQLARQGHERAFEALVQRYRRQLLAHAHRLLGSGGRAEDALQQSLLAAWLALGRGDDVRDAKAWLYRIVHNVSLNVLRSHGHEAVELSPSLRGADGPEADLESKLALRETFAGLAGLPQMQREALLQTAVHGRSREQVAIDLGLSSGAVRGLAYRARATLRATMTAITPTPVLAWAAGAAGQDAPVLSRLSELGAGGGSAGLAAILIKGTAAAVTAGAVIAGVAVVRPGSSHHAPPMRGAPVAATSRLPGRGLSAASSGSAAGAAGGAGQTVAAASVLQGAGAGAAGHRGSGVAGHASAAAGRRAPTGTGLGGRGGGDVAGGGSSGGDGSSRPIRSRPQDGSRGGASGGGHGSGSTAPLAGSEVASVAETGSDGAGTVQPDGGTSGSGVPGGSGGSGDSGSTTTTTGSGSDSVPGDTGSGSSNGVGGATSAVSGSGSPLGGSTTTATTSGSGDGGLP
jgi:RNA polymerase sigma factor (sigma-70 family)